MWALLAIKQAHNVHYFSGNKLASDCSTEAKNKVLVKKEERKEIFIPFPFIRSPFTFLVLCSFTWSTWLALV